MTDIESNDNLTLTGKDRKAALLAFNEALRGVNTTLHDIAPHGSAQSSRGEYLAHKELFTKCARHIDAMFNLLLEECDRIP